jgi:hypothetical protein
MDYIYGTPKCLLDTWNDEVVRVSFNVARERLEDDPIRWAYASKSAWKAGGRKR